MPHLIKQFYQEYYDHRRPSSGILRKVQSSDRNHHHLTIALGKDGMDATLTEIKSAELTFSKYQAQIQQVLLMLWNCR